MTWLLFLSLILDARPAAAAVRRPPLHILVTSFRAFDGAPINGSLEVARALRALAADTSDLQFDFCAPLPVEFGTAVEHARRCLRESPTRPDRVVSLGEGFCQMTLESSAHNVRHGGPDQAGVVTGRAPIEADGPSRIPASLPFVDMYCALSPASRTAVEPSVWPGFFVCNEVAYALGRQTAALTIPYGFVHVPSPTACPDAEPPARTAARLIKMLRARPTTDTACRNGFFGLLARAEENFRRRDDWRWTPAGPRP